MPVRVLQFLAIMTGAVALIPAGAHLAAFPNKIGLPREAYYVAQGLHAGWWVLGLSWLAGLAANATLALRLRAQHNAAGLAAMAALGFALMLMIFFGWTQPANRATGNWTLVVENWAALRDQWEYSHLVNAALAFTTLGLTTCSALLWRDAGWPAGHPDIAEGQTSSS